MLFLFLYICFSTGTHSNILPSQKIQKENLHGFTWQFEYSSMYKKINQSAYLGKGGKRYTWLHYYLLL